MKYVIYCKPNEDGSQFELRCERDGVIVERQTENCFEDVMINCFSFFNRVCEKYWPDTRVDTLFVNLNYQF